MMLDYETETETWLHAGAFWQHEYNTHGTCAGVKLQCQHPNRRLLYVDERLELAAVLQLLVLDISCSERGRLLQ